VIENVIHFQIFPFEIGLDVKKISIEKSKLGDLSPLSTQGPNNNTKIQIIEMKLRKKSTNPHIIMNMIEIKGNKECYKNDKK